MDANHPRFNRMKWLFCLIVVCLGLSQAVFALEVICQGKEAPHRGVYELQLQAEKEISNPYFDVSFQVQFTRPDQTKVTVDGFYDGEKMFKARAYCDTLGTWTYRTLSTIESLNHQKGSFVVVPSELPGKLRIHPDDPRQFAYDNGQWFLHIGDTGYRFVVKSEPRWQEYIDQAAEAGFTKIRTWFAQARGTVEALYTPDRKQLEVGYWQEIDRRLQYCLNHYPQIILQLIPYAEDTKELIRDGEGDPLSRFIAQYAQARWSAYPNVHWEISNDREIVKQKDLAKLKGRQISYHVIAQIGRDMKAREPWGTLLTNQQNRRAGYAFVKEPWSDIITLEDIDQVGGELLLTYREKGNDPVVLDEDRYENYIPPKNRRYFFRRFMWASLLSGGHATYGGLKTYEPYGKDELSGVQGYYLANERGFLSQGAHDYRHVQTFFTDTGLTLAGMVPADALVGGDPLQTKCIHDGQTYIVYAANPDGTTPETDNPRSETPTVNIQLPAGSYQVKWFDPCKGTWEPESTLSVTGPHQLKPPSPACSIEGDWVILIQKK